MPTPWTQSLQLVWRPELRFYEKRIAILKAFEEQGILKAFRVQEGAVDAQLFESRDRLTVRQGGLDLQLVVPDADPDRAMQAVGIALDAVAPASPRGVSATFQHILEIPLGFDEAVRRSYGRVLGELGTDDLRFTDWAMLADIAMDQPATAGRVEFGIIRAREAPDRLSRTMGRATGPQGSHVTWKEDAFPDVALFSDASLGGTLEHGATLAADAAEFWRVARTHVGTLSTNLSATLLSDDARRAESQ